MYDDLAPYGSYSLRELSRVLLGEYYLIPLPFTVGNYPNDCS